jgi:hypothetical protein
MKKLVWTREGTESWCDTTYAYSIMLRKGGSYAVWFQGREIARRDDVEGAQAEAQHHHVKHFRNEVLQKALLAYCHKLEGDYNKLDDIGKECSRVARILLDEAREEGRK